MNPASPNQIERANALRLTSEDYRVQFIAEELRKALTADDAAQRAECCATVISTHIGKLEIHLHGKTVVAKLEYLLSDDEGLGGRYEFFLVHEDVLGEKTAERLGLMEFNAEGKLRFNDSGEWTAQVLNNAPYAGRLRNLILGHAAFWVQQRMTRLAL